MLNPIDTSHWKRQDIIREAQMQSAAIARLDMWKRLAYSLVAIGFILGLWGSGTSTTPAFVAGVVCLVIGVPCSIVLTVGINHAKTNVKNMLTAAGVDVTELLKVRSKKDVEGRSASSAKANAKNGGKAKGAGSAVNRAASRRGARSSKR